MAEQWDKRFASIMKETELSLAKVKRQLSGPVAARSTQTLGSPSRRSHTVRSGRLGRADRQAGAGERVSKTPAATRRLSHSVSLGGGLSPPGTELASLQRHVRLLQSTVEDQSQQIYTLKGNVNRLHKKLSEMEADRKCYTQLEEFKRQVSRELDLLRRQRLGSPSLSQDHASFTAIAQELHSSRRVWSEDLEGVQRDLSHFKSRMVSQESEMAVLTSSLRDVERRQEGTTRALSSVEEWRQSQGAHGTRQLDASHQHTAQMSTVKQSLSSLEHRLSSLERRLLDEITSAHSGGRSSDCPLTMSALRVSGQGAGEGVGMGQRNPLLSGWQPPRADRVPSPVDDGGDLDNTSDDEGDISLSESFLLHDSSSISSLDTTL